ncbi:bifunctional riboflavin kinase/FAD synthetase [Alicyclobacillaceae bacterium I2511]|nr:bifunctional riboflavin kinase/FAD synthetase [Alicyclobacillaceae bacterium I2511]
MEVIDIKGMPPVSRQPVVLAIGKFDGLHLGHQAILRAALAGVRQCESKTPSGEPVQLSVMTFWPHPMWTLLQKPGYERMLTPPLEQTRVLQQMGVQRLFRVHFTPEYANITAEEFVFTHLPRMGVVQVVVGMDFSFGRGGKAGPGDLRQLCDEINIPVQIVPPVAKAGNKVSSSQIRSLLAQGQVAEAATLLGRPYSIVGQVIAGRALGRQIGFPTANLTDSGSYVLPAAGVYGVEVRINGDMQVWLGAFNLGRRPTVEGHGQQAEVHLLDFSGDLYGRDLQISFLARIREEQKFSGVAELKQQIARDVEAVRRLKK